MNSKQLKRDYTSLPGTIGELYINEMLRLLASGSTHLINPSPIPDGTRSENYLFRRLHRNTLVAATLDGKHVAEYDALAEIAGLPVVFDIKIGATADSHRRRGALDAMTPKVVNKKLKPLMDLYEGRRDFGFVSVLPKDIDFPKAGRQIEFIKRGGIVAHLPATLNGFREMVYKEFGITPPNNRSQT
jgi:hypothetical protein